MGLISAVYLICGHIVSKLLSILNESYAQDLMGKIEEREITFKWPLMAGLILA